MLKGLEIWIIECVIFVQSWNIKNELDITTDKGVMEKGTMLYSTAARRGVICLE
jgi:hypothetical protein